LLARRARPRLSWLDNLVLPCSRHNTLVHQHGFGLVLQPDRQLEVRTADSVPVVHHHAQPWGDAAQLDQSSRISADIASADPLRQPS